MDTSFYQEAIDALSNAEPDGFDGCSGVGFIDGCKRMGCHNEADEAKLVAFRKAAIEQKFVG
ncbi:hypothetical protein [Xanthomonas phage BUDD]|nr:hypothetical protein [Xanthomonas phage BUDD]